jgi:hypothetical protein
MLNKKNRTLKKRSKSADLFGNVLKLKIKINYLLDVS